MEHLSFYFGKFSKLTPPDEELKKAVIAAVLQHTGYQLARQDLRVGRWSVYLNTPGIIKSELVIKRKKIITTLQLALGQDKPKMIK